MLIRCGVEPGRTGNVTELDSTGLVCSSSLGSNIAEDTAPSPFTQDSSKIILDHDYHSIIPADFNKVVDNTVVYIAGWVVKKAMSKIRCDICREFLITTDIPEYNKAYHLLTLKNRGGLVVPSCGTVAVVKASEKAIRQLMNIRSVKRMCKLAQVQYVVKSELGSSDVFSMGSHILQTQHGIDNHYFDLISVLVHIYFHLRQHHIAKTYHLREQGAAVRQALTKTILFKGQ